MSPEEEMRRLENEHGLVYNLRDQVMLFREMGGGSDRIDMLLTVLDSLREEYEGELTLTYSD